jgi:hypothetical protein
MDYGLETGFYIFTTAGTLSELGAVKFTTSEEADAKLAELDNPAYFVKYINASVIG